MTIFTNTLYKVAANAPVRRFMDPNSEGALLGGPGTPAFVLMDQVDDSEYDEDPLLIEPFAFITYCAEDDTTDVVVGNTNYNQLRVIWADPQGNEYYVGADKLELFAEQFGR